MKVTRIRYEDLPENEKNNQPCNGHGKEYAEYIKVEIKGKPTIYYSDAMEPEDAIFSRDLSWIIEALYDAYNAGYNNGIAGICR